MDNQQQNVGESRNAHFNDAVFGPQKEPPDLNRQAVHNSFNQPSYNAVGAGNPWRGNRLGEMQESS